LTSWGLLRNRSDLRQVSTLTSYQCPDKMYPHGICTNRNSKYRFRATSSQAPSLEIFTGDSSGDWLVRALFETGFANKPISVSRDDGLILNDAYLTAAIRCAPPLNKPAQSEISNCSQYLLAQTRILRTTKVILALGKIAFDAYCNVCNIKGLKFGHHKIYSIYDDKTLIASYHPSRRNTNTRTLTWQMWIDVFKTARSIIDRQAKFGDKFD